MRRTKLISTVKELPTEFELDVLMEKLVFIEKVEKGIKQAKNKNVLHHKIVKVLVKNLLDVNSEYKSFKSY